MNMCLCFPFDDAHPKIQTYSHLRSVLDLLGKQIPLLAGSLRIGWDGCARIVLTTTGVPAKIPMDIIWLCGQQFGSSSSFELLRNYNRLADSGFPSQAFIDRSWDLNNAHDIAKGPVPVACVRCVFIPKGLLLFLHLHHTMADITGLRLFAEGFAAVSRGLSINIPRSPVLTLPINDDVINMPLRSLAADCSEYFVPYDDDKDINMPKDTSPARTDITSPIAGEVRTFIISASRLRRLQTKLHKILGQEAEMPSVYVCLASLTFAYVYRVRMACESGHSGASVHDHAKLFTPFHWRTHYCEKETQNYFGNAVLTQMTQISPQDLFEACNDSSLDALARVTSKITDSRASVDLKAVLKRDALVRKVSDPRQIALDMNPSHPHELYFDTWRILGDESKWSIPGVTTDCPAAVCRVPEKHPRPGAMILPAKPDAMTYELQLVLPSASMQALCADLQWLAWVDRVSRFVEHLQGI